MMEDGSITIKTTDANICINDLRTDKEDHTEHKVIKVEKDMEIIAQWAKMPQETPRLDELLKKPFYNEFELIEQVKRLVREIGNDQELGGKIRGMFNGS